MIKEDHNWPDDFQIVDWAYTESSEVISYDKYLKWVSKGFEGPLTYLSDHRKDLRKSLKGFYPEFQSGLVFLFSYTNEKKRLESLENKLKVASYVTGFEGIDYHYWIKEKLQIIGNELKASDSTIDFTFSIDAQPVLERDLAYRAGLGWFGKNSMLINKKQGSYFIIASLLLNKKLDIKTKEIDTDHCGNCRACIDACPTSAIVEKERTLDSNLCISTYTIELFKDADPPKGYEKENRVYGCDICQEVCPWNKKPLKHSTQNNKTNLIEQFFTGSISDILEKLNQMSNRQFRKYFKGTPLERTGRIGIIKNLKPFKD